MNGEAESRNAIPNNVLPMHGPSGRDRLATALRGARKQAGLTGSEAGRAAGFGQSKLSKIERGALLPSVDDVRWLCEAYGLATGERDDLVQLATNLREEQSGRLILVRRVGEMQHRIRQLEQSATLIRGFQPAMVPGLLQTEAYARCVFGQPDTLQLEPEEVDDATAARVGRQTILDDDTKRIELVVTEGALRWHAGSPHLMARQLDALASATENPNLRLGVIPWTTPINVFPRHGFHVYDTDAVIVGTETATATLTSTPEVATYVELFDMLSGHAIHDDRARHYLTEIASQYRQLAEDQDPTP